MLKCEETGKNGNTHLTLNYGIFSLYFYKRLLSPHTKIDAEVIYALSVATEEFSS